MRRSDREVTDVNEIRAIVEKCKVLHLGLVDDGMPYVVPMNYGFEMEDGKLVIYLHSGKFGYKMDVIMANPVCCFEMECDLALLEADVACQHGMAYASVIGRGQIEILFDVEEKKKGLALLMKAQTGKDFTFTNAMANVVEVLRIDVDEYAAKRRPMPAMNA